MRNDTVINLLAAVGRSNLIPLRQIPTAAEAARAYYAFQRAGGHKSLKDVQSLIGGRPTGRRNGRQPKVGSFGDHFGATPIYMVSTEDVNDWFALRFPPDCSPSYRKKGKSFLSVFLHYCHSQGWIEPRILVAATDLDGGKMEEDRRWLTPEHLLIFDRVIAASEVIDDYDQWVWELFRDNGLRTFEAPMLTPASLETHLDPPQLVVRGKGRGAGKTRMVPQSERGAESFIAHVERHRIRPGHPVVFRRKWQLLKGEKDVMGWIDDRAAPASTKSINGVFRRIEREVNAQVEAGEIPFRAVPHWSLTAKVMRKTFACNQLILSRLGLGGLDLVQLQMALGHESLTTTKVYLADVDLYLGQVTEHVSTGDAARLIVEKKTRLASGA